MMFYSTSNVFSASEFREYISMAWPGPHPLVRWLGGWAGTLIQNPNDLVVKKYIVSSAV